MWNRLGTDLAFGQIPAQLLAAGLQVFPLRTVVRRAIERGVMQFFVGNRYSKTRAEDAQFIFIQLLLLVRDIAPLAGFGFSLGRPPIG